MVTGAAAGGAGRGRRRAGALALGLVLVLGLGGCDLSLTDYPYCFACQTDQDCPLGTSCGARGACRYPCGDGGSCAVGHAACGADGFCHADDDGGC